MEALLLFLPFLVPVVVAQFAERHSWAQATTYVLLIVTNVALLGLAGLAFKDMVEGSLRAPLVIAVTTIGFGLLLWWADARGRGERDEYRLCWRDVWIIGLAQANSDVAGFVTHHHQRGETEAPAALDHLRHPVDVDDALLEFVVVQLFKCHVLIPGLKSPRALPARAPVA